MSTSLMQHVAGALRDTVLVARRLFFLAHCGSLALWQSLTWTGANRKQKIVSLSAVAAVGAVVVLVVAFLFDITGGQSNGTCPVQAPPARQALEGPAQLVHKVGSVGGWKSVSNAELRQCIDWKPGKGAVPSLEQLRAQLECHGTLLATSGADAIDAEGTAFAQRTRNTLAAVKGVSQRCDALKGKLHSTRRGGAASRRPAEAIVALGGLAGFEKFAREAFLTLKLASDLVGRHSQVDALNADELRSEVVSPMHAELSLCVLDSMREARLISHALPVASPAVQRVQRCKKDMLLGLENLALAEAESPSDPSIRFAAGMLLSEVSIAPLGAPFFGESSLTSSKWSEDSKGIVVPTSIAVSERMLSDSLEQAEGLVMEERSKSCLMRFAKHAKLLAEMNQYAAAEWRYRSSVQIAKHHGHHPLAASTLAQLSYFLSMHGQAEQALEAASDAFNYGTDALASYLQATLRLALGKLTTDEQVLSAAEDLKAIEGKLPAEHLEASRSTMLAKLQSLRGISEANSFSACFELGDAAHFLSCLLGRLAYDL